MPPKKISSLWTAAGGSRISIQGAERCPIRNDDVQNDLLQRALAGDEPALAALFDGYRDRLRRMIRLRLDRRLSGRVDSSDVLQEAYLDVRKRIAEYARDPAAMPFHLWLRLIAGQRLTDVHRYHLGAQMRDAGQEVSLHRGPFPQATRSRWPPSSWAR